MTILSGKRYWLIGASEGIGRCLAQQLAAAGASLILSARQEDRLLSLQAELPGTGHSVTAVDVADTPSVELAAKAAMAAGPLDGIIYNAGFYEPMNAASFDIAMAEKTININTTGALRVLASTVPAFIQRGAGHIVLVGSVAGYRGLPDAVPYGASKAALIHLAENLVCDLSQHGIRVQLVSPGFVTTRLTAKNDFKMPAIISPEKAAAYIVRGMQRHVFEVAFPPLFATVMQLMAALPRRAYFMLIRFLQAPSGKRQNNK